MSIKGFLATCVVMVFAITAVLFVSFLFQDFRIQDAIVYGEEEGTVVGYRYDWMDYTIEGCTELQSHGFNVPRTLVSSKIGRKCRLYFNRNHTIIKVEEIEK